MRVVKTELLLIAIYCLVYVPVALFTSCIRKDKRYVITFPYEGGTYMYYTDSVAYGDGGCIFFKTDPDDYSNGNRTLCGTFQVNETSKK